MRIIGLSGKARHGKDTCAKIIQEIGREEFGANIARMAFAWPLKARVYAELAGLYTFEEVSVIKPAKVRRMLQEVGTEKGRNVFGEEFWTMQMEAFLTLMEESMPFVDAVAISDVRFPNEVMFCRLGGRIYDQVIAEVEAQAARELEYTPEREEYLLTHDPQKLYELDARYYQRVSELMDERFRSAPGLALWIESDRPTLTGEAALHPSETALDALDKAIDFDGIICNNTDVTLDGLREQLRPYVERLLSMK